MANGTYTIDLQQAVVGASNIASMSFRVFQPNATIAEGAADALAVVFKGSEQIFAAGVSVIGCRFRQAGQGASVNLPFPLVEYTAKKADTLGTVLTAETGYGRALGGGALAPLGTSLCVTEYTAQGGRTGRGRVFWPFVSQVAVDANGQYAETQTNAMTALLNVLYGLGVSGIPSVHGFGVGENLITSIKVRRIFSNLRSRRR